jgi:hypothetical protein
MSHFSEAELAQYAALSRHTAQSTVDQLRSLIEGNKHLLAAQSTTYTIGAQCSFSNAIIYGTILINNASYQGWNIEFSGTMWGLGFGAGTSYGALTITVPPNQLNGLKCSFQATNAAVGAGGVTVQIWDSNNGYVANFTGPSLGIGASAMGGSGTWSAKQG